MRELALHILDVARNAIEAGATRVDVVVREDPTADRIEVTIADDGRGMSQKQLQRVFDAEYTTRTTRKWGLGLPMFRATCQRCGGDAEMKSKRGAGTTFRCWMSMGHIDRPPLGDMGAVMQSLMCDAHQAIIHYRHEAEAGACDFDTVELQRELQDVDITHPMVLRWVRDWVNEALKEVHSRA